MEIKFLNQPKEVKLVDLLKKRLKEDFDNAYFVTGMAKDTGFEDIFEELSKASLKFKDLNIYTGIDRKNISKDMLLKLISLGIKLSVHINTDEEKVETRAYIFEGENKISYIYITSSKFSTGGLSANATVIAEVKYDAADYKDFVYAKNNILKGVNEYFEEIDKDEVVLLAEKGEIVARITERKIPKITEMYGGSDVGLGEQVYDESTTNTTIDFSNLNDIEIDFDPGISIRKNVELESEKEAKKELKEREEELRSLKKTEVDLEKLYSKGKNKKEQKSKSIIHMSDEVDFENMSELIIESNKIIEKGVGAGEFKIPKALTENIMNFLGGNDSFKDVADEKGNYKPTSIVKFEIMDNKEGKEITDEDVKLILTDKGLSVKSDALINLKLEEGDIIRLIKISEKAYRCEVIRLNTSEHEIWGLYLKNSIKGNKRKFGVN